MVILRSSRRTFQVEALVAKEELVVAEEVKKKEKKVLRLGLVGLDFPNRESVLAITSYLRCRAEGSS